MIAALLLLAAAAPDRLVLIDQTVRVPPMEVRELLIPLRLDPRVIDCRFMVTSGRTGVRLALMRPDQAERLRSGAFFQSLATTGFERAGGFRYSPTGKRDYSLVVDNTFEGRQSADVRVTVTLIFEPEAPRARVLTTARRAVVILLSAAFFVVVATYAGLRLRGVLWKRAKDGANGGS